MEFRPCIDIHNGKVKQIVGSTLKDCGDLAEENFVSGQDAAFYANFDKKDKSRGGHVILVNGKDSAYYNETKTQALQALGAYPDGLQVGGGITDENAAEFLQAGASHVIVTSYVFREGKIHYGNLRKLVKETGKEHLVLDISCRKRGDIYYVVTDRWQKFTDEPVTMELLEELSSYASEFLVHAVDVEGKSNGVETELIRLLGSWGKIPITYAGGVRNFEDIKTIKELGKNRLNVTIGSALDLFGGTLSYKEVIEYIKMQ